MHWLHPDIGSVNSVFEYSKSSALHCPMHLVLHFTSSSIVWDIKFTNLPHLSSIAKIFFSPNLIKSKEASRMTSPIIIKTLGSFFSFSLCDFSLCIILNSFQCLTPVFNINNCVIMAHELYLYYILLSLKISCCFR